MSAGQVIFAVVVAFFGIGFFFDVLGRLYGVHINDWWAALIIVAFVVLIKWKTLLRALDYLFVRYPIDTMGNRGTSGALPTYRSENAAERSRALRDKLDADAEIAAATLERERARAALADAEWELGEVRRQTERRP